MTPNIRQSTHIRTMRRSLDVTQGEVAALARCSIATVSLAERNLLHAEAQQRWTERIARVLYTLEQDAR